MATTTKTTAGDPFADLAPSSQTHDPFADLSEPRPATTKVSDPFSDHGAVSATRSVDPFSDLAPAPAARRSALGEVGRFAGDVARGVGEQAKQAVTHPLRTVGGIIKGTGEAVEAIPT